MARTDRGAIDVTSGAPLVKRVEVGRLRVSAAAFPAGYQIPSHYHERACLSVILEGHFHQRFPGAGYDCPAGGLLVKPPGERHSDRWGSALTRHVIVEPLEVDDRLGPARPVFEEISYRLEPEAAALARRITRELDRDDALAPLAVEALASELVVLAGRVRHERRPDPNPPAWLQRVREALHDRYAETPRMADLAAEAGVHPTRLSREFRRYFGTSPSTYLRRVRLAGARRDLAESEATLAAVALQNGFSDQSHLTRELRRATGMTPGAYRRARRL